MSEPDFSDADYDQYDHEMSDNNEYDEMVRKMESDDPLSIAIADSE